VWGGLGGGGGSSLRPVLFHVVTGARIDEGGRFPERIKAFWRGGRGLLYRLLLSQAQKRSKKATETQKGNVKGGLILSYTGANFKRSRHSQEGERLAKDEAKFRNAGGWLESGNSSGKEEAQNSDRRIVAKARSPKKYSAAGAVKWEL